ncbi:MAG: substrate-binding domain-containing protein, partial [Candidatus Dormibacteraeota bacterium]|nr:substrate-binding domain-containing protein [Candidatus Dormibacteraeota bacterium]
VQDATDLNGAVDAVVSIAPAPDNCPQKNNDILGVGSSSAYDAIYRWEATVCLPPGNAKVGYTGGAIDDYVQPFFNNVSSAPPNTVAFGVTGPLPSMPAPPAGSNLAFHFAPLTSSAVVLAYLMYDRNGAQITSLTLTPDLIAQIVLGEIPNWNTDQQILALNPSVVNFPSRILAYYRAESSAMTYVETSWLAANAPNSWAFNSGGTNPTNVPLGASTIFPSAHAGSFATGVTGADNLGFKVATYAPLDELDQGAVGFMDSSTAAFYGLPTVQIQRPDGSVVAATTTSITQAINDDTLQSDGTLSINFANADPQAYPLSMPTYMLVPSDAIAASQGASLQKFLLYAVQAGQQNEPAGYAPLPGKLASVSLQAAAHIPTQTPANPPPTPSAVSSPATVRTGPLPSPTLRLHAFPASHPGSSSSRPAPSACPQNTPATTNACAAVHTVVSPTGQRFSASGDWAAGSMVVPGVIAIAALLLTAGVLLWFLGVRRRLRLLEKLQ